MKKKIGFLIYPFVAMGVLLMVASGCKKEEITKKDPVITWENPADITFVTLLSATQLNATADVAGTFVYTPSIGTKLDVGANQDLKVYFTPIDLATYNVASKTVKIDVIAKLDPVITWANPADITFVTLLSVTQLNAIADVAGAFVYTPSIGTVLNVGANQNLKVVFTPADTVIYNTASKIVTINVTAITTVTDYDGNVYNAVVIGTQTWMVENLKVTHYRNGEDIPNVTDSISWLGLNTGAYCWYNNDITNKATYGALYNWYSILDTRNIAPTGWHVSTDAEWKTLEMYLGMPQGVTDAIGLRGTNQGTQLKATSGWNNSGNGTNSSGFSSVPSGCRLGDMAYRDGAFGGIGLDGYFWSSSEDGTENSWFRVLDFDFGGVGRAGSDGVKYGFSIRCVKD